jgi:hypothetical protein
VSRRQRVYVEPDPRRARHWRVVCDACGPNPAGLLPIPRKKNAKYMAWMHRTSQPHAAKVRAAVWEAEMAAVRRPKRGRR